MFSKFPPMPLATCNSWVNNNNNNNNYNNSEYIIYPYPQSKIVKKKIFFVLFINTRRSRSFNIFHLRLFVSFQQERSNILPCIESSNPIAELYVQKGVPVRDFDEKTCQKETLKTPKKLVIYCLYNLSTYSKFHNEKRANSTFKKKTCSRKWFELKMKILSAVMRTKKQYIVNLIVKQIYNLFVL